MLPTPSPDEIALTTRLTAQLRDAIARAGGAIGFDQFMAQALYTPGLGYYSAGRTKFGAAGDFITAPELGDMFARTIARGIAPVLRDGGDMLELGAGSGVFAADVLVALAALDASPSRYRILETSADLRERQRETIAARAPAWSSRVEWLDAPPTAPWRGVLFANEVIDALPVRAFALAADGVYERVVVATGRDDPAEAFAWSSRPADAALAELAARVTRDAAPPPPFASEACAMLSPWFAEVTGTLREGLALFVDYGYARREYYLPQRDHGTLLAHHRHRVTTDVLRWPGLVDLTASVDFTAVAEAGVAAGFDLACYAAQAPFLIAAGLPAVAQESATDDAVAQARIAQQIRKLTMPAEMGERFQAIAFTRGIDAAVLPFAPADRRIRL